MHGHTRAAEHLSWRPGWWRAGWRGGRSQATWGQGGGRLRAAGRGTAEARARVQLKARRQKQSPFLAGPSPPRPARPKQQDAPGARLHRGSLQDQQDSCDNSAGQRGAALTRRSVSTAPVLTGVSAPPLGWSAWPWALSILHGTPHQGDSPDRRAHGQARQTRAWSPTPACPRFPAGRPLPGHLLTWEREEGDCLPPPVRLTQERQWEESRRLGQWNRGWGLTEGPRGRGHLTPIRPPTEQSTELGRLGARKDATRLRSPEALAVRSRRRG